MEDCISNNEEKKCDERTSWKPFLRQLLICTGVWTSYFMYGLCMGAPTVFIPQIRKESNSSEVISDGMASWLSSTISFSGFPCVLIIAILTKHVGRKISFTVACVDTFIAFLVFFFSTTVTQILISEIMQGLFSAAQIVISNMILTEYTSPKHRGLFLVIKAATLYWGIWVSNTLGTFFHWKKIGLLGIVCAAYTLTTILIWPESPYWLASQGRYEECATCHRWLKGCDIQSEKELETLISNQKEYIKRCSKVKLSRAAALKNVYVTITLKEFYKPTLISIMTGLLSILTGKLMYTVYALDIIKKITKSDSTAYTGMLILDGITVLSMYIGCILTKYFKRRSLLLTTSSIGVLFLYVLSLYLYLIKLSIITENNYVSMCLMMCFSIAISCGPLIMSIAVYGELIPIRSRNLAVCIIALVGKLITGVSLKIAPYMIKTLDLQGTFLFFGINASICIIMLYKYLPETKDKTLQEISDSFLGVTPHSKVSSAETAKLVITKDT